MSVPVVSSKVDTTEPCRSSAALLESTVTHSATNVCSTTSTRAGRSTTHESPRYKKPLRHRLDLATLRARAGRTNTTGILRAAAITTISTSSMG